MQNCGRALAAQHRCQLPPQIKRIAHRYIHPLSCFGAVGMARVPGNKHPRIRTVLRIIKTVAQALADLVDRPPNDLFHVQLIRGHDPPCCCDQLILGDILMRYPLVRVQFVQFDIKPHQIPALAGDNQH